MTYEEIALKYEALAAIEETKSASDRGDSYHAEKALTYHSEANRQRAMAAARASDEAEASARLRDVESAISWREATTATSQRSATAWESIAKALGSIGPEGVMLFGPRGTEIVR